MPALIAAVLCLFAAVGALAERLEPLPPEQAFRFSAAMDGGEVVVVYEMPEGIYLYQHRLLLTTATPAVALDALAPPPGTLHEDEFFGKTTVYYDSVTLRVAARGEGEFTLRALSQGCDEQIGICYPPLENTALLVATGGGVGGGESGDRGDSGDAYAKDEAGYLSKGIADNSIFWTIAVFFLLGVGLSFTPCVLPMLPILLGVIGGGGKTRRRILLLTAAYIAGVAVAFTAFGILAALSGQMLAAALQTPWALGGVALVFVLLSLSLFGAYDLQLPAALRNRLAGAGGGGGIGGAAVMGAVSAVAVSPCVAAPLIGALLYIGKSGDVLVGGAALLSLALGMSVLLAVAGVAGAGALPRAGAWMEHIKHLFGILLLAVAVWVASPLVPITVQLLLYGLLLLFGGALAATVHASGAPAAALRALALALALWGAMMLIGAAAGGRDLLTPLSPLAGGGNGGAAGGSAEEVPFIPIASVADLDAQLANANGAVMLDFYADWCVSCKEFERFTLTDARVQQRLQPLTLLRADVTKNNADDKALLARFELFGPPAILFFRADGTLIKDVRVIGYENADAFLDTLAVAGI